MIAFIARRLMILPLILLGVTFLTFGMLQLLGPIQQLSAYIGSGSELRCRPYPECIDALLHKYGLDQPLHVRYINWLNDIIHGDFGFSQWANRPVLQAVADFFPATLELAIYSFIPVIIVGVWLGILSAVRQDSTVDHTTRILAILGYAFPSFVLGLIILLVFYGILNWFPPGRLSTWADIVTNTPGSTFVHFTGLNTIDGLLNNRPDITWDAFRHLVGPVLTLSFLNWALLLRVMRSSMLEEMRQDYVRTARAKGLHESVVINKHASRNALISAITVSQ